MIVGPGQQQVIWTERHGYWLRGRGIENATCLGKQVIGVQTLQGIAILRMFSEADQAAEAWADVKAGMITPPAIQTKEYGSRYVPAEPSAPSRRGTAGRHSSRGSVVVECDQNDPVL